MKQTGIMLFLLSLILASRALHASAIVSWAGAEGYACHITQGPFTNRGFCDQAFDILQYNLPDFKHRKIILSPARLINMMQGDELFCTMSLIYTKQRTDYLYFSQPLVKTMPFGLVVRADDHRFDPLVDNNGYISLADVVNQKSLIMGKAKAAKYSPSISKIIDNEDITHVDFNPSSNLTDILAKGRIDYIVSWGLRSKHDDLYRYIPLTEADAGFGAPLACLKTKEGKAIIDNVNQFLQSDGKAKFGKLYEDWLLPSARPFYNTMHQSAND